jgi:hypothetical protein
LFALLAINELIAIVTNVRTANAATLATVILANAADMNAIPAVINAIL